MPRKTSPHWGFALTELLMIPGPIEISPAVRRAMEVAVPSHTSTAVIEAHGRALRRMRQVWLADDDAQPFVLPGSGTLAMEVAVHNTVAVGDVVLVVNTGYFSDRIAEMARRRGATVHELTVSPGSAPTAEQLEEAFTRHRPAVVLATHVDTSTGVRIDPAPICALAREVGALTIFDGVCATAGERFEMGALGADVYLTASQKAIGLPPGLALLVASARALERRERLGDAVPMVFDWQRWRPVMQAYEAGGAAYFSTPATLLILALDVALGELVDEGMNAVFERHQACADAMREAWRELGLQPLGDPAVAANTLSALRYPDGVGPELIAQIRAHGVVVAGGLYPGLQQSYFRVGHMGYSTTQPEQIETTIEAVRRAVLSTRS